MPFSLYIRLKKLLKAAGGRCDECGCGLTTATATIVTDDTGTFPVCECCENQF